MGGEKFSKKNRKKSSFSSSMYGKLVLIALLFSICLVSLTYCFKVIDISSSNDEVIAYSDAADAFYD